MFVLLDLQGNVVASDDIFIEFLNSIHPNNFQLDIESRKLNFSALVKPSDRKHFLQSLYSNQNKSTSIVVYRLNDPFHSWTIHLNQEFLTNSIYNANTILCDILPLNYLKEYSSSKGFFHPFLPNFQHHGLIVSYNGKIIYSNETTSKILELSHDQVLKLSPENLFSLKSKEAYYNHHLELYLPSGTKKWICLTYFSFKTVGGKLSYFIFFDSTYQINLEEQLKIFKYIVDHAGMEFYLLDQKGNFVYVNEASARSLGYDLHSFKKLSVSHIDELYTPEKFKQHFNSLKNGENTPFITIHKHKDGRLIYKRIKSVYLKVGDKEYIYGFGEDITEQKRIKEFLQREHTFSKILIQIAKNSSKNSDEIIAELLENLLKLTNSDYVSLFSTYLEETSIIDSPRNYRHSTSIKRKEISDFLYKTFQDIENKYLRDLPIVNSDTPNQIIQEIKGPKGEIIKTYIAVIPIKNKSLLTDLILIFRPYEEFSPDELNQLFFFSNSASDIVRRFQAEEHLRRREKILEAVSKCSAILLRATNWEDEIQKIIEELGNSTGVSRCYIFRNKISPEGSILTDQLYEWCAPGIIPQIDNPALQNFDYVKNGYKRWVDILSLKQPIFGCVKDFPEEEKSLLLAQDIKSIVVVPIFVFDEWWGLIGFDECLEEKRWSSPEIYALNIASKMIGSAIERKHIQETLLEQKSRLESIEKLTSLGLMASGIAHEINNPLTTISLGVQNLEPLIEILNQKEDVKEEILSILEKIKRNVTRIEGIIKGIKVFAHSKVDLRFESYSLEKIIEEAVEIVSNRLKSSKVKLTLPNFKKPIKIQVIPSLFVQVIVNLLNNAIDAVQNVTGPHIMIEITEERDSVSISILDNGVGIPPELIFRITEPFFTTKSKDSQLGLGLAISKAILDIHGGKIDYESKEGYTKFTLTMKKVI